jgi:hypothetical protein
MLGDKKKSSNRLSSLFSKAPSEPQETAASKAKSPTPSESTGRLTKVRHRLSSATHLAPEPQAPIAPRPVSLSNPAIQPLESESAATLAPLEPPPPLAVPGSRSASPSRGGGGSRPGTPGGDSASEGNLKKLRRRSKLFGGSQAGDGLTAGGSPQSQGSPDAWIVGHKGKVPYTKMALLLNGDKVGHRWGAVSLGWIVISE